VDVEEKMKIDEYFWRAFFYVLSMNEFSIMWGLTESERMSLIFSNKHLIESKGGC